MEGPFCDLLHFHGWNQRLNTAPGEKFFPESSSGIEIALEITQSLQGGPCGDKPLRFYGQAFHTLTALFPSFCLSLLTLNLRHSS